MIFGVSWIELDLKFEYLGFLRPSKKPFPWVLCDELHKTSEYYSNVMQCNDNSLSAHLLWCMHSINSWVHVLLYCLIFESKVTYEQFCLIFWGSPCSIRWGFSRRNRVLDQKIDSTESYCITSPYYACVNTSYTVRILYTLYEYTAIATPKQVHF